MWVGCGPLVEKENFRLGWWLALGIDERLQCFMVSGSLIKIGVFFLHNFQDFTAHLGTDALHSSMSQLPGLSRVTRVHIFGTLELDGGTTSSSSVRTEAYEHWAYEHR